MGARCLVPRFMVDELIFLVLFDGFCALAQGEAGLERLGLLHQSVHQLAKIEG